MQSFLGSGSGTVGPHHRSGYAARWLCGRKNLVVWESSHYHCVTNIINYTYYFSWPNSARPLGKTVGLGQDGGGGGDAKVTYFLDRDPTCPPRHHSENGLHEGSPPGSRLAHDRLGERSSMNKQVVRGVMSVVFTNFQAA